METYVKPSVYEKIGTTNTVMIAAIGKLFGDDVKIPAQSLTPRKPVE